MKAVITAETSYNTAVIVIVIVLVFLSVCCCCGLVTVCVIAVGLYVAKEKKLDSFTNLENQNELSERKEQPELKMDHLELPPIINAQPR